VSTWLREASIYGRGELDAKLEEAVRRAQHIVSIFNKAYKYLLETRDKLSDATGIGTDIVARFNSLIEELRVIVHDAVDELVVNELGLDVDVEKYEEKYGVRLKCEAGRQLGVVLVKEDSRVEPVVICINYKRCPSSE
jgi:hypothetical protein